MKITFKILLAIFAGALIYVLYPIWMYYIKPDPKPENFVGLTRLEVLDWVYDNARNFKNPKTGEMEFQIGPHGFCYSSTKERIINDPYFMTKNEWDVGYIPIYYGRKYVYVLTFKGDIVTSQYSFSIRE